MGIGSTRKSFSWISIKPTLFGTVSASISDVTQEEPGCIVQNFYLSELCSVLTPSSFHEGLIRHSCSCPQMTSWRNWSNKSRRIERIFTILMDDKQIEPLILLRWPKECYSMLLKHPRESFIRNISHSIDSQTRFAFPEEKRSNLDIINTKNERKRTNSLLNTGEVID